MNNIPIAVRLTGDLDVEALRQAVVDVVSRHDALRTRYPEHDGVGYQSVLPVEDVVADWDFGPEKVGADSGLMIGDTRWDYRAAARAGIPAVAVLTGGFGEAELREAGAVDVFTRIEELREGLDGLPVIGRASADAAAAGG